MKYGRIAAAMAFSVALLVGGGGRRKLWDLDLARVLHQAKNETDLVWGLRFSPDETKLAVGYGVRERFLKVRQHVAVVSIDSRRVLKSFDVSLDGSEARWRSIEWSPSGAILAVRSRQPLIFRMDGEEPCKLADGFEFGGFLAENRIAIFRRGRPNDKAELKVLGSDCAVQDSWEFPGTPLMMEAFPNKEIIAIYDENLPINSEVRYGATPVVEIVGVKTHEVLQWWPWYDHNWTHFRLVDQASIICGRRPISCFETGTEAKIPLNNTIFKEEVQIQDAAGGLLAISHDKSIPLFTTGCRELPVPCRIALGQTRMILEIRSGKEVASWDVGAANAGSIFSPSPSGKLLAEGSSGSLSVYAVDR